MVKKETSMINRRVFQVILHLSKIYGQKSNKIIKAFQN